MNTVIKLYVGTYSRQLINILNPLNVELNPICHMLALLEARHIFHVSGLRVQHRWVALLDTVVVMLFYRFCWNKSLL